MTKLYKWYFALVTFTINKWFGSRNWFSLHLHQNESTWVSMMLRFCVIRYRLISTKLNLSVVVSNDSWQFSLLFNKYLYTQEIMLSTFNFHENQSEIRTTWKWWHDFVRRFMLLYKRIRPMEMDFQCGLILSCRFNIIRNKISSRIKV